MNDFLPKLTGTIIVILASPFYITKIFFTFYRGIFRGIWGKGGSKP